MERNAELGIMFRYSPNPNLRSSREWQQQHCEYNPEKEAHLAVYEQDSCESQQQEPSLVTF
jgi:hypothetical protein